MASGQWLRKAAEQTFGYKHSNSGSRAMTRRGDR